jgi:hypothetical protein
MRRTLQSLAIVSVIASALAGPLATSALAQDTDTDSVDALLGSEIVTDENLGKANGKEAISLNAADLNSVHGYNQANDSVTGNANIGAGALSDINGTAAVVMNTGNNSVVQVSQQIIFNLY